MKYFLIIIFFLLSINTQASIKSMYVAGGCFWCVEEVYEKVEGVLSVYSGYSGGHVENPTYQEVVLGNTGHIEAVEINYDSSLVNEEQLVKLLFLNIDPFDEGGQFCDRGYSYKSAFFTSDEKLTKMSIFALKLKFCCFKYLQSIKSVESIVLIGFFTRCNNGISLKIHKKL